MKATFEEKLKAVKEYLEAKKRQKQLASEHIMFQKPQYLSGFQFIEV